MDFTYSQMRILCQHAIETKQRIPEIEKALYNWQYDCKYPNVGPFLVLDYVEIVLGKRAPAWWCRNERNEPWYKTYLREAIAEGIWSNGSDEPISSSQNGKN